MKSLILATIGQDRLSSSFATALKRLRGRGGNIRTLTRPTLIEDTRMSAIHFDTPENVQLSYKPAGLGTRFVAWFVDGFLVILCLILLVILFAIAGAASDSLLKSVT